MSLSIIPSIGRKVWFFANAAQVEPMDATIVKVHAAPDVATPTTLCNLKVNNTDDGGHIFVHAAQASEDPVDAPHFRWMPYQIAQAPAPSPAPAPAPTPPDDMQALTDRVARVEDTVGTLGAKVEAIGDHVAVLVSEDEFIEADPPAPPAPAPAPAADAAPADGTQQQ